MSLIIPEPPLPRAVGLYRAYLRVTIVGHALAVVALTYVVLADWTLPAEIPANLIRGGATLLLPIAVLVGFTQVVLLRLRPSPAAYGLHQANLLAAISGIIFLPLALPLWWQWRRAEVQRYFGVEPVGPGP